MKYIQYSYSLRLFCQILKNCSFERENIWWNNYLEENTEKVFELAFYDIITFLLQLNLISVTVSSIKYDNFFGEKG